MNPVPHIPPHLQKIVNSKKIRSVVKSQDLAQLGDFLINFVYTSMRIGYKQQRGSIHVWDSSLGEAVREVGLRPYYPNKTKTAKLADGAEALIAYAYYNEIMTLEEMIELLNQWMSEDDFTDPSIEKLASAAALEQLLKTLKLKFIKTNCFIDLEA